MLTESIAAAYRGGAKAMARMSGITAVVVTEPVERSATLFRFETTPLRGSATKNW